MDVMSIGLLQKVPEYIVNLSFLPLLSYATLLSDILKRFVNFNHRAVQTSSRKKVCLFLIVEYKMCMWVYACGHVVFLWLFVDSITKKKKNLFSWNSVLLNMYVQVKQNKMSQADIRNNVHNSSKTEQSVIWLSVSFLIITLFMHYVIYGSQSCKFYWSSNTSMAWVCRQ